MVSTRPNARKVPAVEVEDLVVTYGGLRAVDGLSIEAFHGEVFTLLGPNGAGKTTTVETLEGYRRPESGHVRVLGMNPLSDRPTLSRRIGVMLQQGGVYPAMNAIEALSLFAAYYDKPADVSSLIKTLRLDDVSHTQWRRLSGGEQQRLSLALALVGNPDVLFLDEPTAGVDPEGRLAVRKVIRELRESGKCIIMTTHELSEADLLSDRVAILSHGHKIASGTPAEIRSLARASETTGAPRHSMSLRVGGVLDHGELAGVLGLQVTQQARSGEYLVDGPVTPSVITRLASWLEDRGLLLEELRIATRTLEDAYLEITSTTNQVASSQVTGGTAGKAQGSVRKGIHR